MENLTTTAPQQLPWAQEPWCMINRTEGAHGRHKYKKYCMSSQKCSIITVLHTTSPIQPRNAYQTQRKYSKPTPSVLGDTHSGRYHRGATDLHPSKPITHLDENQTAALLHLVAILNTAVPQSKLTPPAQLPRV